MATALIVGSSLLSAGASISAGNIARKESELAAKGEELAAVQREGDRKSRLADALATQSVSASARGIAAFEGSPLTVLQEDIRREEVATERDVFQSRLAALTQRTRGRVAQQQGLFQAGATTLKAGSSIAAAS